MNNSVKYTYFYGESNIKKTPHKHNNRCFPFIIAVHVNNGQYICRYNKQKLIVLPGETLIVPEYVLHHVEMENNGSLSWAHFSAHYENDDILCNYEFPFIIPDKYQNEVKSSIEAINNPDDTHLGALRRIYYISGLIIDIFNYCGKTDVASDKAWIKDLKKYITKNITKKFRLCDLAAYCHMSESSFSHKFQSSTGVSPIKYIIRQKINASLKLLDEGDTLTAVSQKLGFANEYYYSKQFKAITGMTPSDYRNKTIP